MTPRDDLTAFLAALDEDERRASALGNAARSLGREPDFWGAGGAAANDFWHHFEPPRMLREIAAKRAILAEHAYEPLNGCRVCAQGVRSINGQFIVNPADWPCPTIRALIAVYANQPE